MMSGIRVSQDTYKVLAINLDGQRVMNVTPSASGEIFAKNAAEHEILDYAIRCLAAEYEIERETPNYLVMRHVDHEDGRVSETTIRIWTSCPILEPYPRHPAPVNYIPW